MRKLLDIKRTKTVDELAFGHNPMAFGKSFLAFFIITMIVYVATNTITNTPLIVNHIIISIKNGTFVNLTEALIKFMEEPYVILPWWGTPLQLFGGIFAIIAVTVYIKKFEKRKMSAVGIRKNGAFLEVILGAVIGAALIGATFLITAFSGAVSYKLAGFDLRILLYALAFLIFAFGEELLVRGFFMNVLARDMKPIAAIIISSFLYALSGFSSYNIMGFVNTFVFGLLLGVFVFKRGSIWGAVAIRFVWSFVGASILGTPVFGAIPVISVLLPEYNPPEILSGTSSSGFEGGLIMTAILAVAILLVLLLKTKKGEESSVKIEYFN